MNRAKHVYLVAFMSAHATTGLVGARVLGVMSGDPSGSMRYLVSLSLVSTAVSAVCFAAIHRYLARGGNVGYGMFVGMLCGALSCVMIGMALVGMTLPLAQFLALFAPGLLAVLLASLMDPAVHAR